MVDQDQDLDLDDWFVSHGTRGAVMAAMIRHAARDRLLAREAGRQTESWTLIGEALAVDEFLFRRAPGCLGLHAVEDWQAIPDTSLSIGPSAIELCALAGLDRSLTLPASESLFFPVSGLALSRPSADHVTIKSAPGLVEVKWADSWGKIRVANELGGEVQTEVSKTIRVHKTGAFVRGVRVEQEAPVVGWFMPPATRMSPPPLSSEDRLIIGLGIGILRECDEPLYEELVAMPLWVVPLVKASKNAIESFTVAQIPAMAFATVNDPLEYLHLLTHEFNHLRLYLLEESYLLAEDYDVSIRAPWRADTRKLRGFLHGLFVFDRVSEMFERVFSRWPASERGVKRLTVWRTCIEAALDELGGSEARLTRVGTHLVERVATTNYRALEDLRRGHSATATWAERSVRQHMAKIGTASVQEPSFLGV
jgi:HEXXH motif-containing protein